MTTTSPLHLNFESSSSTPEISSSSLITQRRDAHYPDEEGGELLDPIDSSAGNGTFRGRNGGGGEQAAGGVGEATMSQLVLNLVKNLVGTGALALPNGVAAFASAPSALFPATFVLFVLASIYGYYFHLIGRVCRMTSASSYCEAWEVSIGKSYSRFVVLSAALCGGLGNLGCSMVLADTGRSLLASAGVDRARTECLLILTVFVLLPLCLIKKLSVLSPFSLVGLVGLVFTAAAMAYRYHDGSYNSDGSGRFLEDIPTNMRPSFGKVGVSGALSVNISFLVCVSAQAYLAHYNAPRFYVDLKSNTMKRFGALTAWSFGITAFFYVIVLSYGFLTFGSNSAGFILNNYSTEDNIVTMCRAAVFFAVVTSYPLIFMGFRNGVVDFFTANSPKNTLSDSNCFTVAVLSFITFMAMHLEDLGAVSALTGGLLGTLTVFVFPTLMFRSAIRGLGKKASVKQLREVKFATVLMYFGIALGVVGVWLTLSDDRSV